MQNERKRIGEVLLVQVQREPLKTGELRARVYDPASLTKVDELHMTSAGVVGLAGDATRILDAHHQDHPKSRFRGGNGISVGFTGNYEKMRTRYGSHIFDGVAGENIIVTSDAALIEKDLAGRLVFENPNGTSCSFRLNKAMAPCNEFSHFVNQADQRLAPDILKGTLQFLNEGVRGFTLLLDDADEGRVQAGAILFLDD